MRLPPELILEIIEEAALQNIVRHRSFVAALCRVCRSVQLLVEPILYNTVRFDTPALCSSDAACNPRFAQYTRRLVISKGLFECVIGRAGNFPDFANVEFLVMDTYTLYLMASQRKSGMRLPRPKATFLTSMHWANAANRPNVFATLSAVTHLALASSGGRRSFTAHMDTTVLKLSHVLIDFSPLLFEFSLSLPDVLRQQVSVFLDMSSVERIVCRCTNMTAAQYNDICNHLRELADPRVAVLERTIIMSQSVLDPPNDQEALAQQAFEQDIIGGYDAWYSGTVLCPGI